MSEEIRVFDGRFIEALQRQCKELIAPYEKILARLEDAKERAKRNEDVWMLGILRDLEEGINRSKTDTWMFCGLVESLKERVKK